MKNILLTGGTGFVGRNLREALQDNYNILAPRHSELELLDYDALAAYVAENHIDVIIHAAVHVPMFNGAEKEFFNDMQMFANLEKISHSVEKLIYFGSGAEYDKRFDIEMAHEEDIGKSVPVSEYGLAKYTMNMIARQSGNIYNLRLFGIFGKYELWNIKFLSNLCCKAVFELPLTVRRDCKFDFLSIEDLPAIVAWFVDNTPMYHDYNVCMGKEYWLTELAAMVQRLSGKELPITLLDDSGRNLHYTASNERLKMQLPGLQITPMQTALDGLLRYYNDNRNLIDYNVLKESK